jgi:hypothetical protein
VLAVLAVLVCAPSAAAHPGNPNYRSVIRTVSPKPRGLELQVLGFDNQLQMINRTGTAVVIDGYQGEPYARLLADGTVQQNRLSPATYLNDDRFAQVKVPSYANAKARPEWQTVDHSGRFIWHDHRMHWMGRGLPPKVHDKGRRTKIFDYRIPLEVAQKPGAIRGELFWVGRPSGFPLPALISLVAVALIGIVGVLVIRRRRRSAVHPTGETAGEAW